MKINVISHDNGVGLSVDVKIVTDLLESIGHFVNYVDREALETVWKDADSNIFLEVICPSLFIYAKKNYLIPNPEWFFEENIGYLQHIDKVLCKTQDAVEIFSCLDCDTEYIGFTSIDKSNDGIKRERGFLHIAGMSSMKNTLNIQKAFIGRREKLYIVKNKENKNLKLIEQNYPNIIKIEERLSYNNLKRLMNKCLFHVCTSEYEGFGHYINESKSCGAVIISTNAAPMNELIPNHVGILCEPSCISEHGLAMLNMVNPSEISKAVDKCLELSDTQITILRTMAKTDFKAKKQEFETKFKNIFNVL